MDSTTVHLWMRSAAGSVGSAKFQLNPMLNLRFIILFVSVRFSEHLSCVTFCCSTLIPVLFKKILFVIILRFRQFPLEEHEHSGSV